jgi:hypothetical protein
MEEGDIKEFPASAFLFEMLTSSRAPWMGGKYQVWQREVLRYTYCPCVLGEPGLPLPVLTAISVTQIHYLSPCIFLQFSSTRLRDGIHDFEPLLPFPACRQEVSFFPFLPMFILLY